MDNVDDSLRREGTDIKKQLKQCCTFKEPGILIIIDSKSQTE